jgi:hypothetical protein
MNTAADKLGAFIVAQGLTMAAEFIPYSKAAAKREDWKTDGPGGKPWRGLTWRITISKGGREVIGTDYSTGIAHCPAYKAPISRMGYQHSLMRDGAISHEIETGKTWVESFGGMGKRIDPPAFAEVLASLAMDASVLDEATFEDWASSLGYEPDSRKAEAIYRACLEIALRLRSALGDNGLSDLREAAEDY